jgi:hypothetical protein
MARKKKVIEDSSDWQVSMTNQDPSGKTEQISKTVSATSQQDAVRQAQRTTPNGSRYTTVAMPMVGGPGTSLPPGTPQGGAPVAPTPISMKKTIIPNAMENRLTYPYSIMLPVGFRDLLRECPSVFSVPRYGRLYVEIHTPEQMKVFMEFLQSSKNPILSETVLNGIKRSAR